MNLKRWKKHGNYPLIAIPEKHESGKAREPFAGKKHRLTALQRTKAAKK